MSYRFLATDASIEAGFRRIAGEQLGSAARALSDGGDPVEAVHKARKALKKTRALLRLLRPGFKHYRRENRCLRDIGRALAPLRDADVSQALLDGLCDDLGLSPEDRAVLGLAPSGAAPVDPAAVRSAAADELSAAAERAEAWSLSGKPLAALAGGMQRSIADGVTSMEPALTSADPAQLHEFRKRVKDRWYHSRLLLAVWPEMMAVEVEAADALAERLGDHQDLAVLAGRLTGEGAAVEAVADLIRTRRRRLVGEIRPLARRLYAEAPEALALRRTGWWRAAAPSLPEG